MRGCAAARRAGSFATQVDWSSLNVLAVGLGSCVYLWSACTSKVTKLCDLGPDDCITSVAWTQRGQHLSVGTNNGMCDEESLHPGDIEGEEKSGARARE